jgi:hypothetical protein
VHAIEIKLVGIFAAHLGSGPSGENAAREGGSEIHSKTAYLMTEVFLGSKYNKKLVAAATPSIYDYCNLIDSF